MFEKKRKTESAAKAENQSTSNERYKVGFFKSAYQSSLNCGFFEDILQLWPLKDVNKNRFYS